MNIIEKNKNVPLAHGLTSIEFQCRCKYSSCRATIVSPKLQKAFEKFRVTLNTPLKINSGYRCPKHNFDVGGQPLSRHTMGEAVDVSYKNLEAHFTVAEIEDLARKAGFNFIRFYPILKFFHIDVRRV